MNWRTLVRAFLFFLAFAALPGVVYAETKTEGAPEAAATEAAAVGGGAGATETAPSEPLLTLEEIKKLPLKALREKLADRGVECKACSEKEDYVTLFVESQALPIKAKPAVNETSEPPRKKTAQEKMRENAQMADLMDRLKSQGFGNSQMFNAEDMKNMSPEDMAAKMGGNPFGGGAKRPKASSNTNKKESSSSSTKKKASTSDAKSSTTKKPESAKTTKAKKETAKPKKEAKKPKKEAKKASPVKKPTIRIEEDAFPKKVFSKKAQQLEEEEGDYVEL